MVVTTILLLSVSRRTGGLEKRRICHATVYLVSRRTGGLETLPARHRHYLIG